MDFEAFGGGLDLHGLDVWRNLQRGSSRSPRDNLEERTHIEGVQQPLFRHRVEALGTPAVVPEPHVVAVDDKHSTPS